MGSISLTELLSSPVKEDDEKKTLSLTELLEKPEQEVVEPLPVLDKGKSLKVNDIVDTTSYVDTIRDYMVDRKGKQFIDMDKEELVDKFVAHMRYFNTNEMFTIDEVRYVSKANEDAKASAGKAYQIYDKLGNVFVNDGLTTDNCTLNGGLAFDEPVRISLKMKLPTHPSFIPPVKGRSNLSVVGLSSL